ncbi:hypothetical protein Pcinc_012953 [Petrolisthes cinctipes]|uniref:Ig-like domain-containing protein n=1 Tax=Petrolisthes cinctipes TaxID=88211 RepID=A0AAE1KSS6_PETCI|nr:hypothetical protein Pcinc_012953 [Petrolisthes cinctipes]
MLAGSVVGVSGWGNIDVGSDGRTLQVVRAGTHNPDDYTCTATNQAGVIDIPVTLNDLVPPVIAWKKSGVMGSVGVGEEVVWVKEGGHAALEFSTTSVAVVLWHTGSGVNNLISAPGPRPGRRTKEEQYRMVQYLQGQDTIDSTS